MSAYPRAAALRERFLTRDRGSGEHAAVAVLLGSRFAGKVEGFIDRAGRELDWLAVLDHLGAWSHGERVIVATAYTLWRSEGQVSVADAAGVLDEDAWRTWLAMVIARRTGQVPDWAPVDARGRGGNR